jgi:hypothetical protein
MNLLFSLVCGKTTRNALFTQLREPRKNTKKRKLFEVTAEPTDFFFATKPNKRRKLNESDEVASASENQFD